MLGNKAVSPVVVGVAEKGGASKRRPFFTSPDEVYEEYYEEQLPEKKRRLTSEQVIRFLQPTPISLSTRLLPTSLAIGSFVGVSHLVPQKLQ